MSVSLVFDIIIFALCAFLIIKNAVRGFIKSFVTFAKTILAFLLAYLFCSPVAKFFSDKIFIEWSRGWIYDAFCSTQIGEDQYALYQLFDGIPEWFTKLTVSSGVEDWMVQEYFGNETPAPMWALNQMSNSLGKELSLLISKILAFIAIFILVEILISILGFLLSKIGKLPVLKFVNVLLGALIGVIVSFAIAWIITKATVWFLEFGAGFYPNVFNSELLSDSRVVEYFNSHDVWKWITGIFK